MKDSFDPETYPGERDRAAELGMDGARSALGYGLGKLAGRLAAGPAPVKGETSVATTASKAENELLSGRESENRLVGRNREGSAFPSDGAEKFGVNTASIVESEAAALRRIGQNPSAADLSLKQPNSVLFQQAEKISTAKPYQSTVPRDLNEQALWSRVLGEPAAGRPLSTLSGDQRFSQSAGFTKMEATHRFPDGSSISIHYQYNSITGKAYDMKIVTQQPSVLQPGPSIG